MKSILLTGAKGLTGSNIHRYLTSRGYKVFAVDKKPLPRKKNNIKHDLTKPILKQHQFPEKIDYIIHLAADVDQEEKNPIKTYYNNVLATYNILNYAVAIKAKRFIYASTTAVYAQNNTIKTERSPVHPKSTYALSKYIGEITTNYFAQKYGLKTVIMRLGYILGPNIPHRYFIYKLISQLQNNQPIEIINPDTNIFSFVDVEDIARFCIKAFFGPSGTFNLTGKTASIRKILKHSIGKFPAYKGKVTYRLNHHSARYIFSNTKLQKEYKFKYRNAIQSSLNKILADIN